MQLLRVPAGMHFSSRVNCQSSCQLHLALTFLCRLIGRTSPRGAVLMLLLCVSFQPTKTKHSGRQNGGAGGDKTSLDLEI